ncbi:hypothetical protein TCEL_02183 [Thermobrachium celere DSM 8682]|uniref:Uncharacterized protein n=1 Tax=Thermobrachium celere DSM 8682 TaxID=941824 RepID=R7RUN5_9CLOT|nr:hypothetical protein TCEL_02183 [Thermobrachium celere DSM 8682]
MIISKNDVNCIIVFNCKKIILLFVSIVASIMESVLAGSPSALASIPNQ